MRKSGLTLPNDGNNGNNGNIWNNLPPSDPIFPLFPIFPRHGTVVEGAGKGAYPFHTLVSPKPIGQKCPIVRQTFHSKMSGFTVDQYTHRERRQTMNNKEELRKRIQAAMQDFSERSKQQGQRETYRRRRKYATGERASGAGNRGW